MRDLALINPETGFTYLITGDTSGITTFDEFKTALGNGTLKVRLKYNQSDIRQMGDWFNKANCLPDDVAEYLGLTMSNPQIKDAFLLFARERIGIRQMFLPYINGTTEYSTDNDRLTTVERIGKNVYLSGTYTGAVGGRNVHVVPKGMRGNKTMEQDRMTSTTNGGRTILDKGEKITANNLYGTLTQGTAMPFDFSYAAQDEMPDLKLYTTELSADEHTIDYLNLDKDAHPYFYFSINTANYSSNKDIFYFNNDKTKSLRIEVHKISSGTTTSLVYYMNDRMLVSEPVTGLHGTDHVIEVEMFTFGTSATSFRVYRNGELVATMLDQNTGFEANSFYINKPGMLYVIQDMMDSDTPIPEPEDVPVITMSSVYSHIGATCDVNLKIEATNSPTSYRAENLPSGLRLEGGYIKGTLNASSSQYRFKVYASNQYGESAGHNISIAVISPATLTPTLGTFDKADPNAIEILLGNVSEKAGAVLLNDMEMQEGTDYTVEQSGASWKYTLSSEWLAELNEGDYSIAFETGRGIPTYALTVMTGQHKPVIIMNSQYRYKTADTAEVSIQITATNNPTSYRVTGLPSELSYSQTTGMITGTIGIGDYSGITVYASNEAGESAGHGLTINVAIDNSVIFESNFAEKKDNWVENGGTFEYGDNGLYTAEASTKGTVRGSAYGLSANDYFKVLDVTSDLNGNLSEMTRIEIQTLVNDADSQSKDIGGLFFFMHDASDNLICTLGHIDPTAAGKEQYVALSKSAAPAIQPATGNRTDLGNTIVNVVIEVNENTVTMYVNDTLIGTNTIANLDTVAKLYLAHSAYLNTTAYPLPEIKTKYVKISRATEDERPVITDIDPDSFYVDRSSYAQIESYVLATNNPTSYRIDGDSTGKFRINDNGLITADDMPVDTYTFNVYASNIDGESEAYSATISVYPPK